MSQAGLFCICDECGNRIKATKEVKDKDAGQKGVESLQKYIKANPSK
jgi:hypothetical protein